MLLCSALGFSACSTAADAVRPATPVQGVRPLIAVFPVENLSGRVAPLEDVRRLFVERLEGSGLSVLDDAALEDAITRHRVRYTAGLDAGFAKALQLEAGVEAILIPSLEFYDPTTPPRVALFARLVSAGEAPVVRWIDGKGAAGDDAPGILGLGLIDNSQTLLAGAVDSLTRSLAEYLATGGRPGDRPWARKFGPKVVYRTEGLDSTQTHSIAVVPFFNKSVRRYAGELIALHMIRSLMTFPSVQVIEPGVVREELLRFRIIMNEGVSLSDTETIVNAVNADLVLNGEVLEYRDAPASSLAPSVDFAVLFVERKTRRVVYSSYSHNTGADRVYFFDWGRVKTAHAMTAQMARAIADRMLHGVGEE